VCVCPQRDDGVTLNLRAGVGHLGQLITIALTEEPDQVMVRQGALLAGDLQAQPHGFRPGTQLSWHCTALLAIGFREALSMYRLVHS